MGHTWVTDPLSRIATHGLTFQQLYGELEAAMHLEREAKRAIIQDNAGSSTLVRSESKEAIPGIMFEGQGQYVRSKRGVGRTFRNMNQSRKVGWRGQKQNETPKFVVYFNCDDSNHKIRQCLKPVDLSRVAKCKMEFYERKSGN